MFEHTDFLPKLAANYQLINFIEKPLTKSEDIIQSLMINILEKTFEKIKKKEFIKEVDYFENIKKYSKSLINMKNCINNCLIKFKHKKIKEDSMIEAKTILKDTFFKEPVKIKIKDSKKDKKQENKKILKGIFSDKFIEKKKIFKNNFKKNKKEIFLLYEDKKNERKLEIWLEKRMNFIKNIDKMQKKKKNSMKILKSSLKSEFKLISQKKLDLKKVEKYMKKNKYETYLSVLTNLKDVKKKNNLPSLYKNLKTPPKINFKLEEKLMTKNLSFKNLNDYKKTFFNHTKSKSFKISSLPKDDFKKILKKNYKDKKNKYEYSKKLQKEQMGKSIIIETKKKFFKKIKNYKLIST